MAEPKTTNLGLNLSHPTSPDVRGEWPASMDENLQKIDNFAGASFTSKKITVPSSALKNLTTKFDVLPAPGAGKRYRLISDPIFKLKFATTPYTFPDPLNVSDNQIYFGYDDPLKDGAEISSLNPDFFRQSNDIFYEPVNHLKCSTDAEFVSASPSSLENLALVIIAVKYSPIATASVQAGGTGYAEGDTGTITPIYSDSQLPGGYVVDSVDGGGAVLTFHLTDLGNGFELSDDGGGGGFGQYPTVATTGGGTGFFVNVDTVGDYAELTDGDGDLVITLDYVIDKLDDSDDL